MADSERVTPVPAGPADAVRFVPLMREFYAHERLEYGPRVEAALAALLAEPAHGLAWLLRAPDGRDAGYLVLTWGWSLEFGGRFGLVDELYVAPGFRGAGAGSRALAAAAGACLDAGALAVRLEVDHANPGAEALYRRMGFGRHDRHIMTRRLGNGL